MSETLLYILTRKKWCRDLGPASWMEFLNIKEDGAGRVSQLYFAQEIRLNSYVIIKDVLLQGANSMDCC